MAVLSASVVSKRGKIIVSRHFAKTSRVVIESMLSAFPKLVDPLSQSILVDKDHIRYLYQPLEGSFYLVLLATQSFGVFQDIYSLRLLARLIAEICHPLDETSLEQCSFEIIFAFDEMFSVPGISETPSMSKIMAQLSMESHSERIEEAMAKEKERETKQKAKEKIREIEQQKSRKPDRKVFHVETERIATEPKSAPISASHRGMVLSKKKPVAKEPVVEPKAPPEDLVITGEERVTLEAYSDGRIERFEVTGNLNLLIATEKYCGIRILVNVDKDRRIQYKTHPKIDKKEFNDHSTIQTIDPGQKFPLNQKLSIVKWRVVSDQENDIPLLISCWPNYAPGHGYEVIVEYQLGIGHLELQDVTIVIPLPSESPPNVKEYTGKFLWRQHERDLQWTIKQVDSSKSQGSIEFSIASDQIQEACFPISTQFRSSTGYIPFQIRGIETDNGFHPEYRFSMALETDNYTLEC